MRGELATKEQFLQQFEAYLQLSYEEAQIEANNLGIDFSLSDEKRERRGKNLGNAQVFDAEYATSHTFRPHLQAKVSKGKQQTTFLVNGEALKIMFELLVQIQALD